MIRNLTPDLAEACKTQEISLFVPDPPGDVLRILSTCQQPGKGVTNNSYSLSSPSKTQRSEGACFPMLALATQLQSSECSSTEGKQLAHILIRLHKTYYDPIAGRVTDR